LDGKKQGKKALKIALTTNFNVNLHVIYSIREMDLKALNFWGRSGRRCEE
jgi:hypothetical protein